MGRTREQTGPACRTALIAGLIVWAQTAAAQEITDPVTGFSVTPPPGYSAEFSKSPDSLSIRISANGTKDPSCSLQYFRASGPDKWPYDPKTRNWHDRFRTVSATEENAIVTTLTVNDSNQTADWGKSFRDPTRRWLNVLLRAPTGYVYVSCGVNAVDLEKGRAEIEAITRSVSFKQ